MDGVQAGPRSADQSPVFEFGMEALPQEGATPIACPRAAGFRQPTATGHRPGDHQVEAENLMLEKAGLKSRPKHNALGAFPGRALRIEEERAKGLVEALDLATQPARAASSLRESAQAVPDSDDEFGEMEHQQFAERMSGSLQAEAR